MPKLKDGQAYRGYTTAGVDHAVWNQRAQHFVVLHVEGPTAELRSLKHQDDPERTAEELGFSPLQIVTDDECALVLGRAAMSAIYNRRIEQK